MEEIFSLPPIKDFFNNDYSLVLEFMDTLGNPKFKIAGDVNLYMHKEIKTLGNLVEVEDQIQYARRYYNGTVRNFNTAVESFPNNVVAGLFSFSKAEFFVVDDVQDRQVPKVDLGDPS